MKSGRSAKAASPVALLLEIYDEAFDRKAWHGPNLRGSVRRLSEEEAAWRPSPERHSVWEIVVHAAYWKYAVRRRLVGGKRGSFPLEGSNWFVRPAEGRRWKDDVALLDKEHRLLRAAIEKIPAGSLSRRSPGSEHTVARLVYGVAAHDTYHAGQVRLLDALRKGRPKGRTR